VSVVAIRDATLADAIEIAAVQNASWRTTYTGLLPARVIAERTQMPPRVELWRKRLAGPSHTDVALLDGVVCGFAAYCPMAERPHGDAEPPLDFEVYLQAIYVLLAAQRHGIGRALLARGVRRLRGAGYRSMALHVLASNPARAFYERLGARWVRDEPVDAEDPWLRSVYGWDDLAVLEAAAGPAP
jgi:ribosomal protein S18 acetylase RimI-like enzyme